MPDISKVDFNYASVDEETAAKLEYFAKTGKALYRKHQIQFIADMGRLLSEARDVLSSHNKNDGKFIKWATAVLTHPRGVPKHTFSSSWLGQ